VPLKNVTLNMIEDERGALCHCGKRFSRSGLVVHLEEPFGLPTGALQYKPPTPSEGDVVFGDARTDWGTAKRIWTQGANDASVRLSLGMMQRRLTANSLKVDGHAHLFFLVWDTLRDSELYSRAAHHPKHGNSRTEQDGDAHCPGDARRGTVSNHCQLHCVCPLLYGCRRQTAAVTNALAEVAQLAVQVDEVGHFPCCTLFRAWLTRCQGSQHQVSSPLCGGAQSTGQARARARPQFLRVQDRSPF